jgi:hypothetical protein
MGTFSTTNTNMNNLQIECDKIYKEKTNLENQLVVYKLKYAEQSSKIMELEDQKEMYKKRYESCSEKMKLKDDIIKSLIEERDSLKYSSNKNQKFGTVHKNIINNGSSTDRNYNTNQSIMNTTKSNYHSPERKFTRNFTKTKGNIYLNTYTDLTNTHNESNLNSNYMNTECVGNFNVPVSGSKTPGRFVNIIKNIFISDKK